MWGRDRSRLENCRPKNMNGNPARGASTNPVFTCPMHPQIEQDHPGVCPICGMALESKIVMAGAGRRDEFRAARHDAALLGRRDPRIARLPARDGAPCSGLAHAGDRPLRRWIQLFLSTPVVWWAGRPFFVLGARSLRTGHWNMFTLIALGVGAAWTYSTVAFFLPGIFPEAMRPQARCRSISKPPRPTWASPWAPAPMSRWRVRTSPW